MRYNLVSRRIDGWCWYGEDKEKIPSYQERVGKFMTFGRGDISEDLQNLILKAIEQGITPLVKHSDPDFILSTNESWVIVWYSIDEEENLKGLAKFLIDNNLVQKTKKGRYHNISFKYNYQTRNGEYGKKFQGKITLSDFIDLDTGMLR